MQFIDLAKSIIKYNCEILRVPVPSVRIVAPTKFATPTTRASVSNNGREMLINSNYADCSDISSAWLMLSHECRHIYQAFNLKLFNDYQQSSAKTLQGYNAQPAEVDAWAWAVIIMSDLFGVRPTLEKNFGDDVWRLIQARAKQIAEEGLS